MSQVHPIVEGKLLTVGFGRSRSMVFGNSGGNGLYDYRQTRVRSSIKQCSDRRAYCCASRYGLRSLWVSLNSTFCVISYLTASQGSDTLSAHSPRHIPRWFIRGWKSPFKVLLIASGPVVWLSTRTNRNTESVGLYALTSIWMVYLISHWNYSEVRTCFVLESTLYEVVCAYDLDINADFPKRNNSQRPLKVSSTARKKS